MTGMFRQAAWLARSLGRGDLAPFTDDDIRELAESIGLRTVEAGTPLLEQGKPVAFIAVIQRGDVGLYYRSGLRRVMLQRLHEGDVLGDVPYFCRTGSPFSARSLSEVDLLHLEDEVLRRLLYTRPAVTQRFLYSLATRLERMQRRLLEITQRDLRGQVATLLLNETEEQPGEIHLPQSTLAELLGATRPSVNQVLKGFEREGLVRLSYRRLEVVDPDGLRRAIS
ncbi:MAG TPA: Crp/Fnr family transcriptional regulator [Actinomycetota bacterium]